MMRSRRRRPPALFPSLSVCLSLSLGLWAASLVLPALRGARAGPARVRSPSRAGRGEGRSHPPRVPCARLRDLLIVLQKGRREGQNRTKQNKTGATETGRRQRSSGNSSRPRSQRSGERARPRAEGAAPGSRAGEGARRARPTYHDCGRGRGCLGGHRGLVGLVLRSFDFGLQVCRRVKIFAFLPHATPLYVIHTNGYGVVVCVDHGAVGGVCKAAVSLSPGTVSSLELPADLGHGEKSTRCRRKPQGRRELPLRAQPRCKKKKKKRNKCLSFLLMVAFVPFTINIPLSRTQVTGIPGKII